MNEGIYKPNYNLLASFEQLELRKYEFKKAKKFTELCGDWDYRNIDMCDIHLGSMKIQKDKLIIICEKYSPEIEDYISSSDYEIQSKELVEEFKLLDLGNREQVLDFMIKLENNIDYKAVEKELNKQEKELIKQNKDLEEMEIEYE